MHGQKLQARNAVFPEIGTKPDRPLLEPPREIAGTVKTKLPFGPQFDEVVVQHRAPFPTPYNRLDTDLEAIFRLAPTNKTQQVERLLSTRHPDDPLDLNRRVAGHNYQTPLFDAAYNKQQGMVRVLLKYKCDPNAADKFKRTPMHIAAINNGVAVLKTLLNAKADPDARDKYNRTPLEMAKHKESFLAVEFLQEWLDERQRAGDASSSKEVQIETLATQHPVLHKFLDALGHAALLPIALEMFEKAEVDPTMESLYNLEPADLVQAAPHLVDRKQARAIWKAIPNDVICAAQKTASGN